jgi:hypothetical protein
MSFIMIGMNDMPEQEPYKAPISVFTEIKFNVDRQDDGGVWVSASGFDSSLSYGKPLGWLSVDSGDTFQQLHRQNELPEFLEYDEDTLHLAKSKLSVPDTVNALIALEWKYEQNLFVWYRPEELSFFVEQSYETSNEMRCWIFPIKQLGKYIGGYSDQYMPFDEGMELAAMRTPLDFLDNGCMECCWELDDSKSVKYYTDIMLGMGFVLDPELETK